MSDHEPHWGSRGRGRPPLARRVVRDVSGAPLVSIVTPTLNQGRFIEHTIRSLLAQTYGDFEHIVVDGGSTDETHDILRRYESKYRMRWVSGKDAGMYDAINKGLGMAEGRLHAYLNSDDLYFPWTLEIVTAYLVAHPDVDVVYGDTINVDDATWGEHFRILPGFDAARLVHVWPIQQPAAFWRIGVSTGVSGFDPSLMYVGDWDFFIRASQRFRFEKVDEFLAIERRHATSKTIGEEDSMAVENGLMLRRYQGLGMSRARRTLLLTRALVARRAAWLRFLGEARRPHHEPDGPWGRLLTSGTLSISVPRLAAGLIPGAPYRWKVGAIRTGRDWLRPG